jgi:hypothetical protein
LTTICIGLVYGPFGPHDMVHLLQGLRGAVYRVGTTDEVELLVCPYIGHLGQYSRPYSLFGSFTVCRRGALAGVTEQQ